MAYNRKSRLKKINKYASISKMNWAGGRKQFFFEPKGCRTKCFCIAPFHSGSSFSKVKRRLNERGGSVFGTLIMKFFL